MLFQAVRRARNRAMNIRRHALSDDQAVRQSPEKTAPLANSLTKSSKTCRNTRKPPGPIKPRPPPGNWGDLGAKSNSVPERRTPLGQYHHPVRIEAEEGLGAAGMDRPSRKASELLAAQSRRDHRLLCTRGGKTPVKTSRQPRPAIEEAPGRRSSSKINTGLYQPVQEKVQNVWPC